MAEDTRDEEIDVFEIDDFTAASEWERFIYRIEEILGPHGWKLNNNEKKPPPMKKEVAASSQPAKPGGSREPAKPTLTDNTIGLSVPNGQNNREQIDWTVQSESLNFANFNFTLSHHKLHQPTTPPTTNEGSDSTSLPVGVVDSFDVSYDFPPRAHCLSRWYGVKEFLLLTPATKDEGIESEARVNLLWSSVGVALSNMKCQLPLFIQISNWRRRLHYGMCIGGGYRTSYEMIHLQYTPHECNHVHGMIETFKAKIARTLTAQVHVSIRFTYIIKSWPIEMCWPKLNYNDSDDVEDGEPSVQFSDLPLGSLSEPVNDLQFAVSWPSISSDMLNDDSNFSDLNPEYAPQWWLKVRCYDIPDVAMYKHLKSLLHLSKQPTASTAQIVRALSMDDDDLGEPNDMSNALNRLIEPSHILQDHMADAARRIMKTHLRESPLPEKLLKDTLEHLFPDANRTKEEALAIQAKLSDEQKSLECDAIHNRDVYRNLKSAPVNSLTYNLAVCVCRLNYAYGGVQGIAHLWHEFVLEMRYRFENNILIPGLAQTVPNLSYCLIHQKLQMLNCCIQRRVEQESHHTEDRSNLHSNSPTKDKKSVSYKDFETTKVESKRDTSWNDLLANIEREPPTSKDADSPTANMAEEGESKATKKLSSSSEKFSSTDESEDEFFEAQEEVTEPLEADGVLEESEMCLLLCDKPLCIPITQHPPPLTEDVLLEQQEVMTRLGTSEEAARVRAQMQSASLVSDMEAFKAANPGCVLEDFVRWYSPNDWISGAETEEEKQELREYIRGCIQEPPKESSEGWEVEDEEDGDAALEELLAAMESRCAEFSVEGHLSMRMRTPGNTWEELWSSTRPVPVRRQKRLFDDTKEAEKVLHFLSSLRPCEIALHLFPVVIHACLRRLHKENDSTKAASILENIVKEASRIQTPTLENYRMMESVVKDILKVETIFERIQSLRSKFDPSGCVERKGTSEEIEQFINSLLNCSEVAVKGCGKSQVGKILKMLLLNEAEEQQAQEQTSPPTHPNRPSPTRKFPSPSGREYILRTTLPVPSTSSRPCPQRMFTVITPDEFRMAGSFTQDTNFL